MTIIVKTQLGTGGKWHKNGEWATGPRNLLAAVKTATEAARENHGAGGRRTLIEVDGRVLSSIDYPGWPTTITEARAALSAASLP